MGREISQKRLECLECVDGRGYTKFYKLTQIAQRPEFIFNLLRSKLDFCFTKKMNFSAKLTEHHRGNIIEDTRQGCNDSEYIIIIFIEIGRLTKY